MAVLTNAVNSNKATELSGGTRLVSMYKLKMTTAADSIPLSASTNGISTITSVFASLWDKPSAAAANVAASFSGLQVNLNAIEADGTAATVFPYVNLLVIGT